MPGRKPAPARPLLQAKVLGRFGTVGIPPQADVPDGAKLSSLWRSFRAAFQKLEFYYVRFNEDFPFGLADIPMTMGLP